MNPLETARFASFIMRQTLAFDIPWALARSFRLMPFSRSPSTAARSTCRGIRPICRLLRRVRRPQYQNPNSGAAVSTSFLGRDLGPQFNAGSTIDQMDSIQITAIGQMQEVVAPLYSDHILPFDVTISGANEYGAMCAAKIFGVEILNEGWGSSIDDAVSEVQATFVARAVALGRVNTI